MTNTSSYLFIVGLLNLCFSHVLKAWVKGSTWIPIFDVDDKLDPGTLSRKVTSFMMGTKAFAISSLKTKV